MSNLISIFDIEHQPEKLNSLVSLLIEQSESSFLLRPNSLEPIENVAKISNDVLYWPFWRSGPWIIAGRTKETLSELIYTGPFIRDCKADSFNIQVTSLLKSFDWAVFSYFTTYQSDLGCVVSSSVQPIKDAIVKTYGDGVEITHFDEVPIASLRTATFYDYDAEGFFAYELAKINGEKKPLLWCQIDLSDPEMYRKWNNEIEDYESVSWYEKHLNKLKLIEEFTTEYQGFKFRNLIYQASEEQAYLDIWAEASEDHSIAKATFSANTNLEELKSVMSNSYSLKISKDLDGCSDWSYALVYGGGMDEHHAIFRSKDPRNTQKLWKLVGKDKISRF